ncbi:putative nucleoside diphosphate kinase 5 [Bienertia sinuspersici]
MASLSRFRLFSCCGESEKEKTVAIIKPDGVYGDYSDKIKSITINYGFSITKEMKIQLDEVSAGSFYAEHSSKSFFCSLVEYITRSGPVLVTLLEKDNAVADWRELIGPTNAEKAKVTHPQRCWIMDIMRYFKGKKCLLAYVHVLPSIVIDI